tara:strand:+ start:8145 stop:8597 length:453 start_codon:yes stop_codon:yes gene_type:complete
MTMKNTLDIQALWRAMTLAATQLIAANTYPSKDEPEADRLAILKNKVVSTISSTEEKETVLHTLNGLHDTYMLHFMLAGEQVSWKCDTSPLWEHDATVDIALYTIDEDGVHASAAAIRSQLAALLTLSDKELIEAVRVGCDTIDSRIAGE